LQGRILAKLEYLSPGFSKKDRIAKQIIEDAKESGRMKNIEKTVQVNKIILISYQFFRTT
jgi:cysteine synthase A